MCKYIKKWYFVNITYLSAATEWLEISEPFDNLEDAKKRFKEVATSAEPFEELNISGHYLEPGQHFAKSRILKKF